MQPQLSCPGCRSEPDSSAFSLLQLISVYATNLISGHFNFTHFQFSQRRNAAFDSRDIPRIRGLSSLETPFGTVLHLESDRGWFHNGRKTVSLWKGETRKGSFVAAWSSLSNDQSHFFVADFLFTTVAQFCIVKME